eukprot:8417664-Prorocentrum_lima.AAC.1
MTSSLVGSEMCIRDSPSPPALSPPLEDLGPACPQAVAATIPALRADGVPPPSAPPGPAPPLPSPPGPPPLQQLAIVGAPAGDD